MFFGLRLRLTLWYTGIFGIVLLLFGFASYGFVRQALYQGVDEGSRLIADGLARTTEVKAHRLSVKEGDFFDEGEEAALFHDAILILLLDREGRRVMHHGRLLPLPDGPPLGNRTLQVSGRPLRLHVSPLLEDGHREGTIVVVRPLKEVNRALQRFGIALSSMSLLALLLTLLAGRFLAKQAMKPIQASFERLQRFTADASHELRTPLSVIQTQTEVLSDRLPTDPDELREALAPVLRASRRMAIMVSDLLFLARSDAATLEVQPTRLDLDELAEQVVEEFAGLAKAKGLALAYSGTPAPVQGDPERLHQLVANLVDNAVKYAELGEIRVEVTSDQEKGRASVTVTDNGPGIAPEHLPHVFERFYRAGAAREARKPGSGLGLAIAQAVARAHHGQISVQSELGSGTRVILELPLARTGGTPR